MLRRCVGRCIGVGRVRWAEGLCCAATGAKKKEFNLSGPSNPEDHFTLSPFEPYDDVEDAVFNLNKVLELVDKKKYFVVHGSRQSMKTSYLMALQEALNKSGEYSCAYVSAQNLTERSGFDPVKMEALLAGEINTAAGLPVPRKDLIDLRQTDEAFEGVLSTWSSQEHSKGRRSVLLIDEYDTLRSRNRDGTLNVTLLSSLLATLRKRYHLRPHSWPSSVVLCGMRDLEGIQDETGIALLRGSPFNIAETVGLQRRTRGFRPQDVAKLYSQWTAQEGVSVEDGAVDAVMEWTGGHPWLVNRFGVSFEALRKQGEVGRENGVTAEVVEEVGEGLVTKWEHRHQLDMHFDSLYNRLVEDAGVRGAVSKALGEEGPEERTKYTLAEALGLIKHRKEFPSIKHDDGRPYFPANKAYSRVLPVALVRARADSLAPTDATWETLFFDPLANGIKWDEVMRYMVDRFIPTVYGRAGELLELRFRDDVLAMVMGSWNHSRVVDTERRSRSNKRIDLVLVDERGKVVEVVEFKVRNASLEEWQEAAEQAAWYAQDCGAERATVLFLDRKISPRDKSECPDEVEVVLEGEGGVGVRRRVRMVYGQVGPVAKGRKEEKRVVMSLEELAMLERDEAEEEISKALKRELQVLLVEAGVGIRSRDTKAILQRKLREWLKEKRGEGWR